MKLNTKDFRYLSQEDWRVLTAVESGTRNHEVVPTTLITQLAGLRSGSNGVGKSISTLAKADLIAKVKNAKYDGYRLTYGGLDYLSLHAHTKSSSIIHLGSQMGVGKESDIYLVTSPPHSSNNRRTPTAQDAAPVTSILKIHRLGRTSFRSITRNRAYHGNRQHCSWQHLSRLSAQKEWAAMQALYEAGFPVPRPIAWNRHTVVMSLVPGVPLRQVPSEAFGAEGSEEQTEGIARLYGECMEMTLRLAEVGCIHGDFNEFNLLVENVPELDDLPTEIPDGDELSSDLPSASQVQLESSTETTSTQTQHTTTPPPKPTSRPPLKLHIIDFPQITSLSHPNANSYFQRDIDCIKTFFHKKYHFTSTDADPTFEDALARLRAAEKVRARQGLAERELAERESAARDAALEADDSVSVAGTVTGTVSVRGKNWRPVRRLDVAIEAAGFSRKMARELEGYYEREAGGVEEGAAEGDAVEEDGGDKEVGEGEEDSESHVGDFDLPPETNLRDDVDSVTQGQGQDLARQQPLGKPAELTLANLQSLQSSGLERKMGAMSVITTTTSARRTTPKAVAGWAI